MTVNALEQPGGGPDESRATSMRVFGGWELALEPASRWPGVPAWAVALSVAWVALVGVGALIGRLAGMEGPPCLFRWLTTLPCPTCGAGRGALRLVDGDPLGALLFNPLFFALLFVSAGLLALRVSAARRLVLRRANGPVARAPWLWLVLGAALAGNWSYLLLAGI
ncbi:MAG: DUF2752 domain-containing protein [Polyangia bacterium]|jgi:hypothetical protein|nr:DUF2752 domain-containing protein [Polyangia bacterium]